MPSAELAAEDERPGVPLSLGFRWLSAEERAEVEMWPEAKERLRAFAKEADRCRSRAAVAARVAWIGR